MAPSTSPALIATMRTNDAEYYCFDVKKRRDDVGKQLIVPLNCSVNFNLKKLREMLYFEFGMNEDSPIYYIDDDGDEIPISSECEFLEALKFARTFTVHKGVPLLIESMHTSHEHESIAVSEINQYVSSKALQDTQDMENTTQDCSTDLSNMTFMMKDVASKMSDKLEGTASREPNVSTQWNSPPPWFIDYMESMKKDMLHATRELKHMVETLSKRLDYLAPPPCKECCQCQSHPCFLKRHSNSRPKQTDKKRMNAQDEEQASDVSIERTNAKDHERQLRQEKLNLHHELDRIKGEIRVLMKNKYHKLDGMTDPNVDTTKGQEQPVQNNNVREDFSPPSCCMSSKMDLKAPDGELRMNCSITGNQMLYLDCLEDTCDNLMEDIDKVSLCSGCFNSTEDREQEDAFVMIDMPTSESADRLLTRSKVSTEQRQRDNSRDSPSFELLSETPSPRSSLYIDEEHFSNSFPAFENRGNVLSSQETNVQRIYVVDIHGKIYNSSMNVGECVNTDFEKRTDGVYSFVAETLPIQETGFSKSSYAVSNEQNTSQDNATILNDDARGSPMSYLSVESDHIRQPEETSSSYPRMHSQSQTDSGDFMQSFHSHTTSITDNGDIFAESYSSLMEQAQHDRNDTTVMETRGTTVMTTMMATTTSTTTTTTTTASATSPSQKKPARHVRERKYSGADKTRCDDVANKRFRLHHPSREKSYKESVNSSKQTSSEQQTTTDPVHILPETLVTVAAHVGSVAYVTARDVLHKLDKLRLHTKDDSFKRPRVRVNPTAEGSSSTACRSTNES